MRTNSNWMRSLDGRKSLAQFSIPGTHNTCALHEPLPGTSRCQDLTIADQLAIGVRFLDVRCRHVDNAFAIYHGPINQHLPFADVIAVCVKFLDENPTECIVMSVDEESIPDGNTRTFDETFASCLAPHPERWELGVTVPRLEAVRGRIVLLRRFQSVNFPKGIDATKWPINETFGIDGPARIRVQDEYVVPDNLTKLTAIRSLYAEAASSKDDVLYLNYTSGYRREPSGLPAIRVLSDFINPAISQYFTENKRSRFGVTVMDFADEAICDLIVATNLD